MKRLFFVLIFLGCRAVFACDICGCGVGNNYIGILPDFSKHILGLRYRASSMLSHVGIGGSSSYLTSTERYRTLELWGGWNIGKNFRLMASLPYSFNEKSNQGVSRVKDGLGDASLQGFYQLVNQKKTLADKLLVQSLWVGGGVKLPSGKYNPLDKSGANESANLFQLGTGSLDFSLNAMYDIRYQDVGLSTSAAYKINTTNATNYRYGNKLSGNVQAYYKIRVLNTFTVAPNIGYAIEASQHDVDQGFKVDISGGHLSLGAVGAELSFAKFSLGVNYQHPLQQDLAMGIVKAQDRAMCHFSILL